MILSASHSCALLTFSILYLSLSVADASAQGAGRIEGIVLDAETEMPLVATNVFLKQNKSGTFADREGRFVIPNLPALDDILVASHIGYRTREIPVRLQTGETVRVEIRMEPHNIDMEEIIVTADRRYDSEFRTVKAVTVTGEDAIATRPAGSTADALREAPGILVQKTTAGHGTPIIRGLIGKDILLLYNGVRLNRPTIRTGGNQYMETIDAEALTRIEVVRGPGSVLYGTDAVGGMVNMITRPPSFTDGGIRWEPSLRTRYTSADDGRSLHLALAHAGPGFAARLGATARSLGNLDPGGGIPVHDPTGYDEIGGHFISAFRLSPRQTLRVDILKLRQSEVPRYDQYASGHYETYLYDPQDRFLGTVAWQATQPSPWVNSLEWNVSWQREHEGRIKVKPGSTKRTIEDDRITTIGTFLQVTSLAARRHALRWGLEFYADRLRSTRTDVSPDTSVTKRGAYPDDSRYQQLGIFFSDDVSLGPATDLTAGIRWSRIWYEAPLEDPYGFYEDSFSNLTGNLGLSRRLRPWLNLLLSVSRGFRAPNFNDTVVLKESNNWVDTPSPGLKAETSTNLELGVKCEWNTNDIEMFLYYTALDNLIDRRPGTYLQNGVPLPFLDENGNGVPDAGELPVRVQKNVGEAFIRGAEIQCRFRLSERLTLRGNAFYTYGRSVTADEPMSRIPPLMGLLGLKWHQEEATAEIFVRAAADQRRLSARDIEDTRIDPGGTPGWSDWNIRGSRDFGPFNLSITLGNLFDHACKEHGSGVYNPGRHLVLALGWTPGI